MQSRVVGQWVYRIGDHIFLIVVETALNGRGYEATAFRLVDEMRSQVICPDRSLLQSSAPTTWQAAARAVRQLEMHLRATALEINGYAVAKHADDVGVWQLPQ